MSAFGQTFTLLSAAPALRRPAIECRSRAQFCALGPPPPRTPGRADPQVPTSAVRGAVRHGRIPHLYFYLDDALEDAAFGLLDIEIAVCEPREGRAVFELYCVGDGYQNGSGAARGSPLAIELRSAHALIATVYWPWPDVVTGRAEVMQWTTEITISREGFISMDRAAVPPCRAWAIAADAS